MELLELKDKIIELKDDNLEAAIRNAASRIIA